MGEVDAVAWLRQRIRERMYLAQRAIELGNAAEWVEQSSGVLVTGEPTETDTWHGTWPMGDSSLTRLMEANDPGDTIARCEAELAILDEHGDEHMCFENSHDGNTWSWYDGDCRVVRLLASGYRHRPGFPAALTRKL